MKPFLKDSTMATYVHDGWTRTDGFVAAGEVQPNGERFYDALEFHFRPATRREVIEHDAVVESVCPLGSTDPKLVMKAEDLAAEFTAKRVVKWNLKAAGIHDVEINADAMGRIHPTLFAKVYKIIRGSITSDPRPSEDKASPSDEDVQKN